MALRIESDGWKGGRRRAGRSEAPWNDPTDVICTNASHTHLSLTKSNYHWNPHSFFAFIHPYFFPFHVTIVQLLHKLKVRSADGKATLLKVIKNPITRHLPAGCKCYGFSVQGTLYNPSSLACTLPEDKPVVFVLGAMAAGHITVNDHPYVRGGRKGG